MTVLIRKPRRAAKLKVPSPLTIEEGFDQAVRRLDRDSFHPIAMQQGYAVTMVDPRKQLQSIRKARITFIKRTKYRVHGVLNGCRISLGYKQLALLATGRQAGVSTNDHLWLVTIIERTPEGFIMPRTKLSNEQFASTSIAFMVGCELAGLEPSPRQAGKFRRHQGAARLQYDALVQDNTRRDELNERFFTRKAAALKQPEEIA